jgi:hypothetical protein
MEGVPNRKLKSENQPIEEEMLLGLDLLEANGVSLHLKEKKLQIAGEIIPMSLGAGSPLVNEKETGVSLTHLFCIGQHFPLFQFYMVIG